jgi:hypothetical protein
MEKINHSRGGYRPEEVETLVRDAVQEERAKVNPSHLGDIETLVRNAFGAELAKINPSRGGYRPEEVTEILVAVERDILLKMWRKFR